MSCFHFFKVGNLPPHDTCLPNGLEEEKLEKLSLQAQGWREMLDEHICLSHSDTLSSDDGSQSLDPYIFHVCEGVQMSLQRRPILNIIPLTRAALRGVMSDILRLPAAPGHPGANQSSGLKQSPRQTPLAEPAA